MLVHNKVWLFHRLHISYESGEWGPNFAEGLGWSQSCSLWHCMQLNTAVWHIWHVYCAQFTYCLALLGISDEPNLPGSDISQRFFTSKAWINGLIFVSLSVPFPSSDLHFLFFSFVAYILNYFQQPRCFANKRSIWYADVGTRAAAPHKPSID